MEKRPLVNHYLKLILLCFADTKYFLLLGVDSSEGLTIPFKKSAVKSVNPK